MCSGRNGVAARKKRPVLYEVYRKSPPGSAPTRPPQQTAPPSEPPRVAPTRIAEPPIKRPEPRPRPVDAPPPDRWQITITGPTLAILLAAQIVVFAIAFSVGRRYEATHPTPLTTAAELLNTDSGGTSTPPTDDTPRNSTPIAVRENNDAPTTPPNDGRVDSSGSGKPAGPTEPPPVTLQAGYHYVVVQHFGKRREKDAALAAARFLQENGVPCATMTGADIRLIATEAFLVDQDDSAAGRRQRQRADDLLTRIRQLGQQYNKQMSDQGKRGHTFSGCYLIKIK